MNTFSFTTATHKQLRAAVITALAMPDGLAMLKAVRAEQDRRNPVRAAKYEAAVSAAIKTGTARRLARLGDGCLN